jgi:hypothetical protein
MVLSKGATGISVMEINRYTVKLRHLVQYCIFTETIFKQF